MSAARIALIHALGESVAPTHAALARCWPEAYAFDLLDTSLAADRAHEGELTAGMFDRFQTLATYAAAASGVNGRTAGILFTCSAFGPAIDAVKRRASIPVLKPNEAAFAEALHCGSRIGLIVSFTPSAAALEAELRDMAAAQDRPVTVTTIVAEAALAALKGGEAGRHDEIVADCARRLGGVDALVLGQFSMARAAPAVAATGFGGRIITTPDAAVCALRGLVAGQAR
jgi:Asp/Glu/hydantoin racemase